MPPLEALEIASSRDRASLRPGAHRGSRRAPRGRDLRDGFPRRGAATSGNSRAGRGDRPQAVQHVIHRRRDQGRTEPCGSERRLRRTIRATCSTVRSGLENECPHRPLVWMSQNAGATQSSCGPTTAGPLAVATAAISPSLSSSSSQCELRKSRATTLNGSDLGSDPASRVWRRSAPRRRSRGKEGAPWSAST